MGFINNQKLRIADKVADMAASNSQNASNRASSSDGRSVAGVALAAGTLVYNILANERARSDQNKLNALQQQNYLNNYRNQVRDLTKAGFNPSALFQAGGSSAPSLSASEPNQQSTSDIAAMMAEATNRRFEENDRERTKSQKAVAEAQVDNIKAETLSKLLDNDKVRSLLNSSEGNLYLKKALADIGLTTNQSDYYGNYVENQKAIISHQISTDSRYKRINAAQQNMLAAKLASIQSKYQLTNTVVSKLLEDKALMLIEQIGSFFDHPNDHKTRIINQVYNALFQSSSYSGVTYDDFVKDFYDLLKSVNEAK